MLTVAQRYHFDSNGFVVVPSVLSPDDVSATREVLDRMLSDPDLEDHGARIRSKEDGYTHFGPMIEYDRVLLDMAAHAEVVHIAEDLVGGAVRLEETEAIVNSKAAEPESADSAARRYAPRGFHRGIEPTMSHFVRDGRLHYLWVKALILLSNVGPNDGGTLMVRGSHRLPQTSDNVAQWWDESHVAQAEGPAGSVLFMSEATIHSTARIRSDKTRYVLINGYTPPWTQTWPGYEPSDEFVARQTPEIRALLLGEPRYNWGVR